LLEGRDGDGEVLEHGKYWLLLTESGFLQTKY
jgi:hypothetical protein